MPEQIALPELGLHTDISFDDYKKIPAMNQSTLHWGLLSAEHLKGCIDGKIEKKKTAAMDFGTAMHTRLLEPDNYFEKYIIAKSCEAKMKSGQRKGEMCGCTSKAAFEDAGGLTWRCGKHITPDCFEPEAFVSESDAVAVEAIYKKVCNHQVVKLLRNQGGVETVCIWQDGDITMKSRIDKDIPEPLGFPPVVVDIKKVAFGKGSDFWFGKSIDSYGYDLQAFSYLKGLEKTDGIKRNWIWLVIEEDYPFCINMILAKKKTLAIGGGKYEKCLQRYRHGLETGEWPGYEEDIHEGGHNEWVLRQHKGILE